MRSTERISSRTTADRSVRPARREARRPAPRRLSPATAISLQRTAGNRAVTRLALRTLQRQNLSDQQKRVLADAQARAAVTAKNARKALLAKVKSFGMTRKTWR